MKGFLLDENVPRKVLFDSALPLMHASMLALGTSDQDLWDHARHHQLAIVTKDADFSHRIVREDPPPWVVHLSFGNLRKRQFHEHLKRVWPQIEALLPEHKLIRVDHTHIETLR